ncbi:MAG: sulfotransferase [Kiloniellales bacterium]
MDNYLLIIGAMKSGTTSLFLYLAQHPAIRRAKQKEPNFFCEDRQWAQGLEWYESLWDWDSTQHKYAMEASTAYTKLPVFPNAAERIAKVPKRFKFIYLMRNPIERIESHYTHGRSVGWQVESDPNGHVVLDDEMLAFSSYAMQLDEYYKRFPREDIKLILYEDLVDRPVEVVKDVCSFLDLEPVFDYSRIGIAHNKNKHRSTNRLVRRLRWTNAGRAIWKALPQPLAERLKATVGGNPTGNFRLAPSQRQLVLQSLLPDLRRLKNDYGVDVARWGIRL